MVIYEAYVPDWGEKEEDACEVKAFDAEDAAKARPEANGVHEDGDMDPVTVLVRVKGSAKWQKFRVMAEASIDYYAYEEDHTRRCPRARQVCHRL